MAFSSTRTGIPALAKFMAMPPPIVPQPITAAVRPQWPSSGRHVRNLGGLTLGEEDVPLRPGLLRAKTLEKVLALGGHAFFKRKFHRVLDAVDAAVGRNEAACLALDLLARLFEESWHPAARTRPCRVSTWVCALRGQPGRIGNGAVHQVAIDDLVQQAVFRASAPEQYHRS